MSLKRFPTLNIAAADKSLFRPNFSRIQGRPAFFRRRLATEDGLASPTQTMQMRILRGILILFTGLLTLSGAMLRAEDFGDMTVSASAMYSGNTFHGYTAIRVALQNHSATDTHTVTLVFPNRSWSSGNMLQRLSRTVKLEPGARETTLFLRPPLPVNGDGNIRVDVDGRREGQIHAPNANSHCSYNSYPRNAPTVFISRSLDFDAIERLFHAHEGAFTAAKAVGAPDAKGGGYDPNTWMPDTRRYGRTNWLELDYAKPQVVTHVEIHNSRSPTSAGSVELTGKSGHKLISFALTSGSSRSSSSGWITDFHLPATSEPVKTVRLNFGKAPPTTIAIDAVQISGPGGSQWAASARASSDASASGVPHSPSSGSRIGEPESLRAESGAAEWSDNWLSYSPFDAMVLADEDVNSMPAPVLAAIGDYLQAGGNVILAGTTKLPDGWHPIENSPLPDGVKYNVGFGHCFALHPEGLKNLSSESVTALRNTVRDAARYWQGLPQDDNDANHMLPVVASLKIPTRGLVLVMLAFVIVIGPVNIIYLNRRKRRTWMLWTIPAISCFTTLSVFAYSLLREGITPDMRIAGLTVLDQNNHHASTIGATGFYCPLTPSGGLHFDYETEVTPLVHIGYGSGVPREMDWTESQHLSHGWVSARVPAHFHVRKSETRRERVQIIHQNGSLQVVNGLGAPIRSLWFADASRHLYIARNVAAGQQAGLILSKAPSPAANAGPEGLLGEITYAAHTDHLDDTAGSFLKPNSYIAVLDGNPFIENALGSSARPKHTRKSAVVFGILQPPTAQ